MDDFRINTDELSHRATVIKQRGQMLKKLADKLTFQANTYNMSYSLGASTTFGLRSTYDMGLPNSARIASVRNAANRVSRFGNWLIKVGTAIESIVESAMYDDEIDEEYVRKTLSSLESPETLVCPIDNYSSITTSGASSDNYWLKSLDYAVKGDYSNNFTVAGLVGNVAIGFTPVGWIADVRDFTHAVTHISEKSFWENVGAISLGIIAFVPLIGDIKNLKYLKYADEAGDVVKHTDELADIGKGLAKSGDEIIDGISDAGKGIFKSDSLLDTHFTKHGSEFGNITKEEYLKRAQDLINSPAGGNIMTKTRANGDLLIYNKATNEFTVKASDGTIRTLFKPTDGIDYFNRLN